MLVDTHCHLFFDELKKDLDGVLSRSAALGVTKFICVGTNVEDSKHSYELSLKYEKRFNGNSRIIPSKKDISKAIKSINPKIKKAIDETCKRVKDWHWHQKPKDIFYKDNLNFFYIAR